MDPRRFDDLTRAFARSHSRRAVLRGLAGATLGGLLVHLRGDVTAAKPKPPKPKPCQPEGHKSKDASKCCSLATQDDVCCAGSYGDSCAVSGCCADGVCYQGRCVDCLPEGANHEAEGYDASACCSQFSILDICCGEVDGTCVSSRCCAGNVTCHNGLCAECLPEGTLVTAADVGYCCSLLARPVGAGEGRCCGVMDGTCATTQCCAGEKPCHQGICVDCVPNGAPADNPEHCCSKSFHAGACVACLPEGAPDYTGVCCAQASLNDVCCAAELFASCAASGCCDPSSATPFCIEGFCTNCLPEGHVTVDPADCCSGAAEGDVCCGEADGACFRSGCCGSGLDCCNSVCHAQCPPGHTRDLDTCVCEATGKELGDECTTSSECLSGACCGGFCVDTQTNETYCGSCVNTCAPGEVCIDGTCSFTCSDSLTVCEHGQGCFCYPYRPDCICCGVCPAGSQFPIAHNCRGGCGDCCKSCYSIGTFTCCGPFKNFLNPAEGCLEGPFY